MWQFVIGFKISYSTIIVITSILSRKPSNLWNHMVFNYAQKNANTFYGQSFPEKSTQWMLLKRSIHLYTSTQTDVLCNANNEDFNHLLLDCKVTKSIWNKLVGAIEDSINIDNLNTLSRSLSKLKQINRRNVTCFSCCLYCE